jgi:cytidylate kinase
MAPIQPPETTVGQAGVAGAPTSVICVSHAPGAGGEAIARLLAERLGFRYVDDEIVFTAAEAENALPDSVARAESRDVGRTIEVDFNRFENTERLRGMIRGAVHATADEGSVVIVGHAASFALADRPGVLRVLVTASTETCLERLCVDDRHDAKSAGHLLKQAEKDRAAYLKHFYGVGEELPTHYDLLVNTDKLAPEAAAAAIMHAASSLHPPA